MQRRDLVSVREANEGDIPFVFNAWLNSLYGGNEWFRKIRRDIFFKNYHRIIEQILSRPTVSINIACLADDADILLGFSVYEPRTLHYVFVKGDWREIGIAKDLVQPYDQVTHITKIALGIYKKHREQIPFNPFV